MSFFKNTFAHWGSTAKLAALFVLFGFVPMTIVWLIVYNAASLRRDRSGLGNFFERYGDVQDLDFTQVLVPI